MRTTSGIAVAVLFLVAPVARAGELTFTLIGNEAFHINDGETTLLSDFPYRSGAFGYAEYDLNSLPPIRNGLTLITHSHSDHWNRAAFEEMSIDVIGPAGITERLDQSRVIPLQTDKPIRHRGITIEVMETPHKLSVQHYSYRVTWHGIRFYFPGDTESPDDVLKQRDIDVMFITPWLIESIQAQGKSIDAKRLVGYHLFPDEKAPPFQECVTLSQGESFTVPYGDPPEKN
jgi:L-ascorbate metabolism protein UlaG (beta-lactamase superfamily)